MADDQAQINPSTDEDPGPVMARRPMDDPTDLDITPMIDITFLLLIFFIVCSTASMQDAVDLPPAEHGKGVSEKAAVIFTVLPGTGTGPAEVYLGSMSGIRLPTDREARETAIVEAVEEGMSRGLEIVLVKAAKDVKHREVSDVAAAAGLVEGIHLHMAVLEIE